MLNKRDVKGQVTIFIIIAILIIAGVVLFFIFIGGIEKEKPVSPEIAPIKNFVQECLDNSLEDVVFQVGENGGYYFPGSASAKTPVLEVPYYIKNNQNLMPSKEDIENEISKGISREMDFCIDDSALFSEYEITKGKMSVETKIEPERVLVELNYPLTIIKDETKSKIKEFDSEVPVRFGIVYDAVAEFINESLEVEGFCIDCILTSFTPQGLKSNIFWEDNKTAIFIVRDFNSIIDNKEFVFNFAEKFKS